FWVAFAIAELDIELHKIGWHRILVQLGPSRALRYRHHLGIFSEQLGDPVPQTHGFREGCSGETTHRQNKISFVEFREKRASHKGNHGDAQKEKNQGNSHQPAWMPKQRNKNPLVSLLHFTNREAFLFSFPSLAMSHSD